MELLSLEADQVTERWVHLWETKNGSARSVPLSPELYGLLEPLVSGGTMPRRWTGRAVDFLSQYYPMSLRRRGDCFKLT